jgi:hypothetical protein
VVTKEYGINDIIIGVSHLVLNVFVEIFRPPNTACNGRGMVCAFAMLTRPSIVLIIFVCSAVFPAANGACALKRR